MNKTLTIIVGVLGGIMVILLGIVFVLVLQNALSSEDESVPTSAVAFGTPEPTSIMEITAPPPVGQMPATFTPLPTVEATNTAIPVSPEPSNTPLPTNTLPPPTPTRTPVPIILPTNPPPPPTDTPVPQPPPQDTRGLVTEYFRIDWDRSNPTVNNSVWFEFSVINTVGYDVPFNMLGAMPRKDGHDRPEWFQASWGGSDDVIPSGGLVWDDHIKLPESGNYTLRLAICFDGYEACKSGGGSWATMSHEEPLTIN